MRLLVLLLFFSPVLHAQPDSLHENDSVAGHAVSIADKRQQIKFADSICYSLSCFKGMNTSIHVLYKDGAVAYKGIFRNWKLMCGVSYVYDSAGNLTAVKVYEEGVITHEVMVPKR
jgi:hypothetical protein